MALPLLPIILGVAALGSGIVQGISSVKNAKSQADALHDSTQAKINERAKEAVKLMQQQKTSYLKGGVYFDTGTPTEVINETYNTSMDDINAMIKDANTQTKNLERQGKTAFFSSILNGVVGAAASYYGAAGLAGAAGNSSSGNSLTRNFKNWWNAIQANGKTGGFGGVQSGGDSSSLFA
ncbi:MAG: hypothetical protein LUB59_04695 [Candidatus Gastranaerophilales bacterium]|nr:hypothetical protein [Candidatus Gastranaerophilales bacterium]